EAALEMIVSGRHVPAPEAADLGILDAVAGDGALGGVSVPLTTPAVTGTLPGNVTLPDTAFLWEEYAHDIALGSVLDFTISMSANVISGLPADGLSFALLAPGSLFPLVMTSDPTGADALFAIMAQPDGNGNRIDVQIYDVLGPNDPSIPVNISIRQPAGDAPEPGTLALLGVLLLALPLVRGRRPAMARAAAQRRR
ncbi:MAG: hypothetical protein HKO62_08905, partial [Gammaproteobacteria bacterium]|nr:hypothetical protein [Gammaproteobacteria bacterium]